MIKGPSGTHAKFIVLRPGTDQQYEKVKSEIGILEKEKNWYNFNQVLGTIEKINNGVNKWAPWALSRDEMTPQNGMMMQSWQSNSTY